MISLATIKSALLEQGKRIFKVSQYGIKTANESAPFGDDANPIPELRAVFANTSEVGEPVIIGYINLNQLAGVGEKRIYALTPDGKLSIDLWLKNDGTMELGGKTDNLVKYTPLDIGLKTTNTDINIEFTKIAAAIGALGGSYVVKPITTNITQAKSTTLKTE